MVAAKRVGMEKERRMRGVGRRGRRERKREVDAIDCASRGRGLGSRVIGLGVGGMDDVYIVCMVVRVERTTRNGMSIGEKGEKAGGRCH